MSSDDFTLDDFKAQLRQVLQPGLLMRMMSLLPGMGQMREAMAVDHEAEDEINRMLGIIDSMTSEERREPRSIGTDRCRRIARGAGVRPSDVRSLLRQFDMMAPVMKAMYGKGMGQRMQAIRDLQNPRGDDRWRFGL